MTDSLTVIAFDPGETTGYAVMKVLPTALTTLSEIPLYNQIFGLQYGEINCRRVSTISVDDLNFKHEGVNFHGENMGVCDMIEKVKEYEDAVVILEDFILEPSKATKGRDLLTPVRIISSFSFAMWCENLESKIIIQNRSPVKTTCTDERLKEWNLYDSHSGNHARDAVRHAYYFLRSCQGNSTDAQYNRWRGWPDKFADPQIRPIAIRKRRHGERIPGL